jgi:hypothetical protein
MTIVSLMGEGKKEHLMILRGRGRVEGMEEGAPIAVTSAKKS